MSGDGAARGQLDAWRSGSYCYTDRPQCIILDMARRRSNRDKTAAVAYLRVSTGAQQHGLDVQEGAIQAYCAARGLQVTWCRDDGVSSSVAFTRRGAALQLALDAGAGHVVIYRLDRAFRSLREAIVALDDWQRAGVVVHILEFQGAPVDTSSAMGKLLVAMVAGFAELERELIQKRTRDVARKMRDARQAYTSEVLGFDRVLSARVGPHGEQKFDLVPNTAEQAALDALRAHSEAGAGTSDIARRLNAAGHRRKRGGQWTAHTVTRAQHRLGLRST